MYFLGLQVNQNKKELQSHIALIQQNWWNVLACVLARLLGLVWVQRWNCQKDEICEKVDEKLYRGMIGSLHYLTSSMPDLCLSLGICVHYQSCTRVWHLAAVKRIIKYVKGNVNFGIHYTAETNQCLVGYYDAHWVDNLNDQKSTSGGYLFLGNNLMSWHNKKKYCVLVHSRGLICSPW